VAASARAGSQDALQKFPQAGAFARAGLGLNHGLQLPRWQI